MQNSEAPKLTKINLSDASFHHFWMAQNDVIPLGGHTKKENNGK